MAVAQTVNSSLQLTFEDGIDAVTGTVTLKNKTFNNVKTAATADQLLAIADALVPLQQKPLYSVKRSDDALITAL